ncbi:glycosyltransferase, partial [Lacticaseibacillus rhamnosus]
AAAAGIPIVAANVGGIPEIFGAHTDALFAPNTVGAVADAIESALDDPAAAQARAKALRERVFLHFSQKAMVEGVLASFSSGSAPPECAPTNSQVAGYTTEAEHGGTQGTCQTSNNWPQARRVGVKPRLPRPEEPNRLWR